MKEYHGVIYGITIIAKTMKDLKRKASIIANEKWSSFDEMKVLIHDIGRSENTGLFTLRRINRKCPNNTIFYGKWN